MIFEINGEQIKYIEKAREVLNYANGVSKMLIDLFKRSKESVFGIEGYKMDDVHNLFDAMEAISPGSTVKCFQLHAAFGEFLKATNPSAVTDADLTSPVPYEIEMTEAGPRIKLVGSTYPTEVPNEV